VEWFQIQNADWFISIKLQLVWH